MQGQRGRNERRAGGVFRCGALDPGNRDRNICSAVYY